MKLSRVSDGLAILQLERPPANAIDVAALDAIESIIATLQKADDVAVLVIQGNQRFFSAGADVGMMAATPEADRDQVLGGFAARLQAVYLELTSLPCLTIASMAGTATGGGLELALHCDYRFGALEARYGLPEVTLGLIPAAGGTQMLPSVVGAASAARLILTGELVDGQQAANLGLIDTVLPNSAVDQAAFDLAKSVLANPFEAIRANLRCLRAARTGGARRVEIEGTAMLHATDETKARIRRFVDRRAQRAAPNNQLIAEIK